MVSRKDKQRMSSFITGLIEDAGSFDVLSANVSDILLRQKEVEDPADVHILLHNAKMSIDDCKKQIYHNQGQGIYTANIFYKDGDSFFVRLAGKGHFKGDDRSLKNYGPEDLNRMVHLRGLEKLVLDMQDPCNSLVYYQPKTERLQESLREFDMVEVILDYSHVGRFDPGYGFAHNGPSKDYRIAKEESLMQDGNLDFMDCRKNGRLLYLSKKE